MRFAFLLLVAAACGAPSSPRAVRAFVSGAGVDVSWEGAPSASVELYDFDARAPRGEAVQGQGGHAFLPGSAVGVRVGGTELSLVSAGASGGDGSAWQLFSPADFSGGELHAKFTLASGEKLGVLLLNAGGRDGAEASVAARGTAEVVSAQRASEAAPHAGVQDLGEPANAAALAAPERVQSRRSFCVVPGLDFSQRLQRPAQLLLTTEHAEFYVDADDVSHYPPGFLESLGNAFEERVWPSDLAAFGAPTDVDGNGRVAVLLTHVLGEHLNGGWLIGYFGRSDLLHARDPDCSSSGSNHGEIIYLNDVANGLANGYTADALADTVYPATLAHELQHLIGFGRRGGAAEETFIDEGLSKLAEDLAGYGWNAAAGRSEGSLYLSRLTGDVRGYDGRSLTLWEGDPVGNYQGTHSFFRYFADQDAGFVERVLAGRGVAGLTAALGRPLPRAMAEWATALLLSNEPGAPYGFQGAAWSPLHQRLRALQARAPGAVTLRPDGLAAFVTGAGEGQAEIVVHSSEAVPPHVVVVRSRSL